MIFFDRLIVMCDMRNCRPNTIAKSIGLSEATATKWKKGTTPNGDTLSAIADYLDCSVDYLLGRIDTPSLPSQSVSSTSAPAPELSAEESRILEKYRTLDEDGRDAVRGVLLNEQRRVAEKEEMQAV